MTGESKRFWPTVARSLRPAAALLLATVVLWPLSAAASSAILNINVSSLPAGTAGQSYSTALDAGGGTGSYTWRAAGLPAGLGINTSTGTIAGTPSKSGTYTVTLAVYDSARNWGTASLALTVYPALTVPTTITLPAATAGAPYSAQLSGAGGGTGSYTWQATGLPPGLGLTSTNGTATISGTPITSGAYPVALTVSDSASDKTTVNLTLTVDPAVKMSPATLPPATVGTPYSATFSASGGAGTGYTWYAAGLPPGLSLSTSNGTGTISGTPSQYGLFRVTVSVQDSAGHGAGINQYLVVSYPSSSDSGTSPANPPGDTNIGAVGPDGGTVATPDDAVSVDVPSGAFSAQTVLSISQFATPYPAPPGFTPASPQWTISTDGPQPGQPLTISFQYDPTVLGNLNPARLGVYIYNPATAAWKWLGGQAGDNTVTVNTLSLGVFAVQAETQVFQDMNLAPWAQTAVDNLLGAGIVSGTGPGQFDPLQNVTRAQFAVMLDRLTGLAPAADGRTPFADVPPAAWYAPYVAAAVNTNLIDGTSPTTFSPDTPLTREEMAVLLARLPETSSATTDVSQFTDAASIDSWALNAVEEVVGSNLMSGFPDGSFQPLEPTTRAQAAVVLYNYLSQNNQQ